MNYRQIRALLLCGSLVTFAACDSDSPLEGDGEIVDIVADKAVVVLSPGDSVVIAAYPIDVQSSRVGAQVNVTPFGAAVTIDTTYYLPELAETRTVLRVAGNASAGTGVVLEAGGVADSLHIIVATPGVVNGLPAVIFRSPIPVFTEDIHAEVAGGDAVVLSRTASEIALLLPFGASGETEYVFTGFGAAANLDVEGAVVLPAGVTQEATEPNDVLAQAAPLTLDQDTYGALDDDDTHDWYVFTATQTGLYDFSVDWNDDSDVDAFARLPTGASVPSAGGAGSGATSAHPEHFTRVLTAGQQYYVELEMYEFHAGDLPVTTYTLNVHFLNP